MEDIPDKYCMIGPILGTDNSWMNRLKRGFPNLTKTLRLWHLTPRVEYDGPRRRCLRPWSCWWVWFPCWPRSCWSCPAPGFLLPSRRRIAPPPHPPIIDPFRYSHIRKPWFGSTFWLSDLGTHFYIDSNRGKPQILISNQVYKYVYILYMYI